jgi:hypothetical protein
MSLGYATGRSLTHTGQMRRWKDLISYSNAPVPPVTNPTIGMTATSATTSTAEKKFGTASMLISADAGNIQNTSGDFAWWPSGTGAWTIQWWQYIPTAISTARREICSNEETTGGLGMRFGQSFSSGTINSLNIFARGQADLDYWDFTWTRDTWQFVSVCRNGTDVYLHVDGTSAGAPDGGSGAGTRNFVATSGLNKITIGNAGGNGLNGIYIDDFQVFGSTALYTSASYSVPAAEAILTTGTTALFNMNGTNGGTSFPNKTSN